MKNSLLYLLLFFLINYYSYSQYGSIEINTGGFSFIPIFTSDKPHMIIRAGTDQSKSFTLNLLNLVIIDGLAPTNYSLIARYRVTNKKFKLYVGTQFPGYRLLENEEFRSRYVHELRASYPINSKTNIKFLYMHAIGRNFEMNNNFYSVYFQKKIKKFLAVSQFYILYTSLLNEPSSGIAQNISYQLSKNMKLNFFLNKSISGESDIFNKTFGIEYSF